MKRFKFLLTACFLISVISLFTSCEPVDSRPKNITALDEQAHTENNQRTLNQVQPAPTITWSMERDNLIKLKKLQNDRTINFFMYIFIEGVSEPIGYYQVNKVSSVNSQLTNPKQVIRNNSFDSYSYSTIESPSEDGSYGTNGDAVFGFTPEGICIQTNMHYITSTVPLNFTHPVNRLAIITTKTAQDLLDSSLKAMNK